MQNWFVTFGQNHPHRDAYMVVEASSYSNARDAVFEALGSNWCWLYDEPPIEEYAPEGQVGDVIKGL